MGLFRRLSGGLLRIGGALQDCCCRPQSPPPSYNCDCVSFLSDCDGGEADFLHSASLPYYGLATDLCPTSNFVFFKEDGFATGGFVGYDYYRSVGLEEITYPGYVRENGIVGTLEDLWIKSLESFNVFGQIGVICEAAQVINEGIGCYYIRARFGFRWQKTVDLSPTSSNVFRRDFDGGTVRLELKCQPADAREFKEKCCRDRLAPPPRLAIVADRNGLTVNGVLTPWEETFVYEYCVNQQFEGNTYTETEIPCVDPPWGDELYRDSLELVFNTESACDECDCEIDLSGRTVIFEGQSFSYGQGQDFSSYPVYIAEESPGLFKKIVYDDCDQDQQIIKVSEKTAIIYCLNVDGEDKWAVLLISECYERDACDLVSQRTRTVTWDGFFNCGGDGIPRGAPENTLNSDINSTTGYCNAALPPIPSITLT